MEKQLKYGTQGEFVVWDLFSRNKGVKTVVDVRDDNRFRKYDVDFLIEDTNRQFAWVEVKTDSMAAQTGNIAYEFESSKTYHTKGCFEKTQADVIAYYIPDINTVYLINVGILRDYANSGLFKLIEMGDNALGYLLPIEDLIARKIIYARYEV